MIGGSSYWDWEMKIDVSPRMRIRTERVVGGQNKVGQDEDGAQNKGSKPETNWW